MTWSNKNNKNNKLREKNVFFDYLEIYNSLTLIMTKMPLEAINTLQNAVVFSGIHAIYHYLQIFGRKTFLLICMFPIYMN